MSLGGKCQECGYNKNIAALEFHHINPDEKIGAIISYVGFITGLLLIIGYIISRPRAIDVYKGKTELRITYEGNIPVDSAVVFKK